jgi:hypothetical protein
VLFLALVERFLNILQVPFLAPYLDMPVSTFKKAVFKKALWGVTT